jgi:hypothetical protein
MQSEDLLPNEKTALSLWLDSHTASAMSVGDEQQLLQSLDEAICEIEAGRGISMQDAHSLVVSWVGKTPSP